MTGGVVEDVLIDLNRQRGITVVLVTHDQDLAQRMGRQVYLHDGRLDDPAVVDQGGPTGPGRANLLGTTSYEQKGRAA